jgi:hypothetical protein
VIETDASIATLERKDLPRPYVSIRSKTVRENNGFSMFGCVADPNVVSPENGVSDGSITKSHPYIIYSSAPLFLPAAPF